MIAPAPRRVALVERDQAGDRTVDAGDRIAVGDMLHGRRIVRLAVDERQAGRLLDRRAIGAKAAPRPLRAERAHRQVDEIGLLVGQRFRAEPKLVEHARRIVLDHEIGVCAASCARQRLAGLFLQVERDAALVAVDHQERRPRLVGRRIAFHRAVEAAPPVEMRAGLHLHHVGAEIGKMPRRQRPRPAHRQVQHAHAVERQLRRRPDLRLPLAGDRRQRGRMKRHRRPDRALHAGTGAKLPRSRQCGVSGSSFRSGTGAIGMRRRWPSSSQNFLDFVLKAGTRILSSSSASPIRCSET